MTDTIKPDFAALNARLSGELSELRRAKSAAIDLMKDMLQRAQIACAFDGEDLVVEAGAGVWERFCQALGEDAEIAGREVSEGQPVLPVELVEAVREFVRKVEAGEARSKRSYAAFKDALSSLPDPLPTVESVRVDERERLAKLADGGEDRHPAWIVYAPRDQSQPVVNQPLSEWLRSQRREG